MVLISPELRSILRRGSSSTRVRSNRSGGAKAVALGLSAAHSSIVSSNRPILRSASAQTLRSDPEKCAVPARALINRPTSFTPIAVIEFKSRIGLSREPINCGEGKLRALTISSISSIDSSSTPAASIHH